MSITSPESGFLETAYMADTISTGGVAADLVNIEATEDRVIHDVIVTSQNNSGLTVEVSFNSNAQIGTFPETDDTGSGTLTVKKNQGALAVDMKPGVDWNAGEEIHVHGDNTTGSTQQIHVLIFYEPVGEFNRNRLRTR